MTKGSPMLINKRNLVIATLASRDETRPALNYVRVTKEYTEATDGQVFARVSNSKIEDDDFPVVKGFKYNELDKCLVPANRAIELVKMIPKSPTLPILKHMQFAKDGNNVKVAVIDTDLVTSTIIRIRQDHKEIFPDCDKIMPTEKPKATVYVNAKLLIQLLKLAAEYDKAGQHEVAIEFRAPHEALVVKTDDPEQTFYGLVMPLRGTEEHA